MSDEELLNLSTQRKMRAGGSIQIGDIVKDMNSTWPKYQCTGMVISINGNNVTWIDDKTGETVTDTIQDLMKIN